MSKRYSINMTPEVEHHLATVLRGKRDREQPWSTMVQLTKSLREKAEQIADRAGEKGISAGVRIALEQTMERSPAGPR